MTLYPLKFEPLFKSRIWGGRKLADVFQKPLPPDETIGESWELVDLPQDCSIVANGPDAGQSLHDLLKKFPEQILGKGHPAESFPLLIKLLDAQDCLSVQVHPDEAACERMGKGDPKTECWYIIEAEPGAFIYKGLQPGVTREQFSAAIETGQAESLLCKVAVEPGECHFLPSGTVHAIGAGLLIAEVQMPSDTTYRLYDYNRRDTQGQLRELHINDGLESIHWDQDTSLLPVTTMGCLVDCDYFKLYKGHLIAGAQVLLDTTQMQVIINLSGQAVITGAFDAVPVTMGDCVVVPASCEAVLQCEQECVYLTATL
ncbi:MAG: class I mannose-6-phosphate isomerase [Bacteroidales bacterium]|nr:class I mannose-6-phosphate isomerase [Bacteroidales bacterium]